MFVQSSEPQKAHPTGEFIAVVQSQFFCHTSSKQKESKFSYQLSVQEPFWNDNRIINAKYCEREWIEQKPGSYLHWYSPLGNLSNSLHLVRVCIIHLLYYPPTSLIQALYRLHFPHIKLTKFCSCGCGIYKHTKIIPAIQVCPQWVLAWFNKIFKHNAEQTNTILSPRKQ